MSCEAHKYESLDYVWRGEPPGRVLICRDCGEDMGRVSQEQTAYGDTMTERQLQDVILQAAALHGWLAYHTHDSRRSTAGFPDLCLVHAESGRLIFWELKSAAGRVTEDQSKWLAALGVWAEVIRPVDLDRALGDLANR